VTEGVPAANIRGDGRVGQRQAVVVEDAPRDLLDALVDPVYGASSSMNSVRIGPCVEMSYSQRVAPFSDPVSRNPNRA
jgi:hypothetical protein